ncbi:hypothetical protein P8452_34639 [Trifolium repens]|nr:hypothetical protein P8452_34639 [Trifolium repens]
MLWEYTLINLYIYSRFIHLSLSSFTALHRRTSFRLVAALIVFGRPRKVVSDIDILLHQRLFSERIVARLILWYRGSRKLVGS